MTDHAALLEEVIELQKKHFGNATALHIAMSNWAERAAIALMRGQSEVPYGMVLAPVEPTHEMLAMFWRVCNGADWPKSAGALTKRQLGRAKRAYGLMLAAIPTPPKDSADEQ